MNKEKDYNVQIIYEFNVKAPDVHKASEYAKNKFQNGAVGVSCVTDKETYEEYINMGLKEALPKTFFTQDKIFSDLAKAANTDIYDIESLKQAIEMINPKRLINVKKALRKEATQNKDLSWCEGINFALELLEYGGEENWLETEKEL